MSLCRGNNNKKTFLQNVKGQLIIMEEAGMD